MDLQNCYVDALLSFSVCLSFSLSGGVEAELLNIKRKMKTMRIFVDMKLHSSRGEWMTGETVFYMKISFWCEHTKKKFFILCCLSSPFYARAQRVWDNELLNYDLLSWKMAWKNRWWKLAERTSHRKNKILTILTTPTDSNVMRQRERAVRIRPKNGSTRESNGKNYN